LSGEAVVQGPVVRGAIVLGPIVQGAFVLRGAIVLWGAIVQGTIVLSPLRRWPARMAGSLRPSSTLLDTPRRTPMIGSLSDTSSAASYLFSRQLSSDRRKAAR
jgi:hypothetical protein